MRLRFLLISSSFHGSQSPWETWKVFKNMLIVAGTVFSLNKEEPSFEDYLAAGGLANVPFWITMLLLSYVGSYLQDGSVFSGTVIPITLMIAGGYLASSILCKRSSRRYLRIGVIVAVAATIANFILPVSGYSQWMPVAAIFCFFSGSLGAAVLRLRSR